MKKEEKVYMDNLTEEVRTLKMKIIYYELELNNIKKTYDVFHTDITVPVKSGFQPK